jgi:hypothetical protein
LNWRRDPSPRPQEEIARNPAHEDLSRYSWTMLAAGYTVAWCQRIWKRLDELTTVTTYEEPKR